MLISVKNHSWIDMREVAISIIFITFVFCSLAFAEDRAVKVHSQSEPVKSAILKVVKMRATGRVIDITDTTLKIERVIKGTVEPFEFQLEKPITKFRVGDKVVVRYITKDEKNILKEIMPQRKLNSSKEMVQPRVKSADLPPLKGSAPLK